jgi:hypothetical protein
MLLCDFKPIRFCIGCILYYTDGLIQDQCSNLYGLTKLMQLKTAVGLIILQGVIGNILEAAGVITDKQSYRGLCTLVLFELAFLAAFYVQTFGYTKIEAPTASGYNKNKDSSALDAATSSPASFFVDCWKVWDVYGTHTRKEGLTVPIMGRDDDEQVL